MSADFIGGLHDDLVDAMERYERRRRRMPSAPRPATLARAAAVAAALVAILAGLRAFERQTPPAGPHVVAVVTIGGEPVDATFGGGSLWVSDFTGSLVEVDPARTRVARRIGLRGQPDSFAVGSGSAWVLEAGATHCGSELLRYDLRSGRLVDRSAVPTPTDGSNVLVAAAGGVWIRTCGARGEGIEQRDTTGAVIAQVPSRRVDGVAVAAGSAWAIDHSGTLEEIDAASGRVRHRWPALAPLGDPSFDWATHVLAPDRAGVWVLSTGRSAILRIEAGRIVRRFPVEATARPLLAAAADGLWVAATGRSGNRLTRYDARTGEPDETLELGNRRPVALVPTGNRLCVVTGDGRVLFVGS
jgi:hypothetical protein